MSLRLFLLCFFKKNGITVKGNLKSSTHKNIFNIIICVSVVEAHTTPVSKNKLVRKEMLFKYFMPRGFLKEFF